MSLSLSPFRYFKKIKFLKKRYTIAIFLLQSFLPAQANNYYFSSSTGDDAFTSMEAQNPATPWKSLNKLNYFFNSIVAGDSILLKCDDIFYGSIVVTRSGTSARPIVISSYGTGNKPLVTGLITLSTWSSTGGGIYETATAPFIKNTVNLVTLNGLPQAVGRYPNAGEPDGGYLRFEASSGITSITDNQLTNDTNWTGAEAVIRKRHFALEKCKVINQSDGTITYSSMTSNYPFRSTKPVPLTCNPHYGYFIQRDIRTLDQLGEWFFDTATKRMQMYFGSANPSSYIIKASTLDTLINIGSQKYINVSTIALEGANFAGIFAANSGNINIQSCDINLSGGKGVFVYSSPNILIDGVNTTDVLCGAIDVNCSNYGNITVRNCSLHRTGMLAGMGSFWNDADYKGININVANGALIEFNSIDSTGFVGIGFNGSDIMIKNNFVNYYDIVKDDGGGIYTYQLGTDAEPGPVYTNRVIRDNIILNGIGASGGSGAIDVDGIFIDGRVTNVDVLNNSIANVGVNGIYTNNAINMNIRGNTCFNNNCGIGLTRYILGYNQNLHIKENIFFPKYSTQYNVAFQDNGIYLPEVKTLQESMQQIASIDSNYITIPNATGFRYRYATLENAWNFPKPMSFECWKSFTGHDNNTKLGPKIQTYKLNKLLDSNLVPNGGFTDNLDGILTPILILNDSTITWDSTSKVTWDGTSKITGKGSLKITPALITITDFSPIFAAVGAVSSAKKYILRFTTLGTTANGVLNAYLTNTGPDSTVLAPVQSDNFGTTKQVHEFLFDAPVTDSAASVVIEIQQSSGTTYIDDIVLSEADVKLLDIDDLLRFEYNATNTVKTVSLNGNYLGIDSVLYPGFVVLQPYTSKILIKDTRLYVTADVPAISCFGSSAVCTVSATGGEPPYSGTGKYTVDAGKGSIKISVSNPVAGAYTFVNSAVGPVSSDKYYILRFSTLGTTPNGMMRVRLRHTNTPWPVVTAPQSAPFGTTRADHQFFFKPDSTITAASFLIEILQTSGTVYIDNIAFFETTASGILVGPNLFAAGQFETSNSTLTSWSAIHNHLVEWDSTSKISSVYYYNVKDGAGTSMVAIASTTQPAAPLGAQAAITKEIPVNGGTGIIDILATGGVAPYTGTGSFLVIAGTYTYVITDANGCSMSTTIGISEPPPPLEVATTSPGIKCFNDATSVTVFATGGKPPYSGVGTFNNVTAGIGSLRLSFNTAIADRYVFLYSAIGPVDSSKNYILRFSSLGTTENGSLRAALRLTRSPWSYITELQVRSFGTSRVDHEFLFNAPLSHSEASFVIEVMQSSGTVYVDNISIFEADSNGRFFGNNLYANGNFENGISNIITYSFNNNHTAAWDTTSKISNTYYYPVTDDAGAASMAFFTASQPAMPLKAAASSTTIPVAGDSAIVTISASGGTGPYSGTGNFSVTAGTYSYTVTDANSCTSTTTITVAPPTASRSTGSRVTSPNTVKGGRVSTVGARESNTFHITGYPNSSTTQFNLSVEGGTREMVDISVQNIEGKILFKTRGNTNAKYAFGRNFKPGIYIIEVKQGNITRCLKLIKTSF